MKIQTLLLAFMIMSTAFAGFLDEQGLQKNALCERFIVEQIKTLGSANLGAYSGKEPGRLALFQQLNWSLNDASELDINSLESSPLVKNVDFNKQNKQKMTAKINYKIDLKPDTVSLEYDKDGLINAFSVVTGNNPFPTAKMTFKNKDGYCYPEYVFSGNGKHLPITWTNVPLCDELNSFYSKHEELYSCMLKNKKALKELEGIFKKYGPNYEGPSDKDIEYDPRYLREDGDNEGHERWHEKRALMDPYSAEAKHQLSRCMHDMIQNFEYAVIKGTEYRNKKNQTHDKNNNSVISK